MRNSNGLFKGNVLLLHCINIGGSIHHWWCKYQRRHCRIQKWFLATTWNLDKGTIWTCINLIGRWNHGHWRYIFRQQVSLNWYYSNDLNFFQRSWNWNLELRQRESQGYQSNLTTQSFCLRNCSLPCSFRFLYHLKYVWNSILIKLG